MKHNGSRLFNGTTGPSSNQPTNLHHLNSNQLITKSVHHLNNLNNLNTFNNLNQQSNSSYFNLNKNHLNNNYHSHNFYLTPNNYTFYHHPFQEKGGLYRINSALNLDHYEFETNLKREFGSVSSIGALSNNYPHTNHHHPNQVYPITNSTPIHLNPHQQQQEHLLSFYSILKEFKKQNLDHRNFVNCNNHNHTSSQNNKIQDYLRSRSEMSNIDLVNTNNLNLIKSTNHLNLNDKKHFPNNFDGAFTKLNHSYLTNNLSSSTSLSAYSNSLSSKQFNNQTTALLGSNLTLDNLTNTGAIQPSPRFKKKIYKIWDIKSDKNSKDKNKFKMSSESSNNNKNESSQTNTATSTVDGATRAIIKKFTRIGSSKNVNCNLNTNNSNEQTIQEEYRSLNAAASTTHLDDPEVRFEEKLRKKGKRLFYKYEF